MENSPLDWIRKSKSNAMIVEYVRRDFGIDWRYYKRWPVLVITRGRNVVKNFALLILLIQLLIDVTL